MDVIVKNASYRYQLIQFQDAVATANLSIDNITTHF